jgi:hypothetical protein
MIDPTSLISKKIVTTEISVSSSAFQRKQELMKSIGTMCVNTDFMQFRCI